MGAAAGLLLATTPAPTVVLTLADPSLAESSGLAASARHPGVLWTHNDGGPVAQVVAVDGDGATVATVTLAGIDPYDPEALAPARDDRGRPALCLGDVGDNLRRRADVSVFCFTEPARLADTTVTPRWYRFSYPDGPHDAEALLVGPHGRWLIATKSVHGGGLYRAPIELVEHGAGTNRLARVGDVPALVTDGAALPDGRFVLRTYSSAYLYDRPGHQLAVVPLPLQPQGESLAVDGDRLLIGSEGVHSQVLAVPIPQGVPSPAAAKPSHSAPTGRSPDGPRERSTKNAADKGDRGPLAFLAVAAGLVLAAGLVVAAIARRRRSV